MRDLDTVPKACQTARDLSHVCPPFHTWHALARPHHKRRGPGPCTVYQHWGLTHQGPAAMGGTNCQNGRSSHAPSTAVWRACARYKDTVKGNLQWCGIQLKELEAADSDRSQWCSPTLTASTSFEDDRRQRLTAAAYERRQRAFSADVTTTEVQCPACSRLCASRLGLQNHQRIHGWSHNTQPSTHSLLRTRWTTTKQARLKEEFFRKMRRILSSRTSFASKRKLLLWPL